jgi:VIT1/CCC1 family predicted Fe2+/Mn2+ transporter
MKKLVAAAYMRNFVFGVEDSLVSTVGLLSGIAVAGVPRRTLILTGIVLIFVEAFSMAVGSFLSEHSAAEYMDNSEMPAKTSMIGGIIMFFSYFISGFIPLLPYLIFSGYYALWISIVLALLSLFALGLISAKISGARVLRHSFRMLSMGGFAVLVGAAVGSFVNSF